VVAVSDEDWFERALRGDDGATEDDDADGGGDDDAPAAADGDETPDGDEEAPASGPSADGPDERAVGRADAGEGPFAGDFEAEPPTDADGDPFREDFASAFENAPSPGAEGGDFGGFGDGEGPEGEFGGSGFDADAERFDSDIERVDIGIEGLDEMILGGVPRRSLMASIGSAGTGKTTFALQFLHEALDRDRRGVYITLEESRDRIVNTADEKGWEFSRHLEEGRLAVVSLDPVEMANSLSSITNDLPRLVEEFGASRLVLDSVSLLEMMYDHPATRRSEVFDFSRSLKEAGVTIMFTSEASEENPYVSRHGLVEYLSDAVFVLQYVRPSDFRETRLAVEIQKIRDANHSRETKPYEITSEGISVYRQANIF
jgi:KaiC domain protein